MRIIHTHWSIINSETENVFLKNGGWLNRKYFLMSWALSCLQFRKIYQDIYLITDSVGKKLLIDRMRLPYVQVSTALDELSKFPKEIWAIAKIYSYSLQEVPFLHVDGDVYIWDKLDEELVLSPLIAQNLDKNFELYYKGLRQVEQYFKYIPEAIRKERDRTDDIIMANAGILGGTNISFFQQYAKEAFKFVEKNFDNLNKIDNSKLNFIFEQYLFYCLAQEKEIKISTLFDEIIEDSTYRTLGLIDHTPKVKYVHAVGLFKKNSWTCQLVARRLRLQYPDYYYRILKICNEDEGEQTKSTFGFKNPVNSLIEQTNLRGHYLSNNFEFFSKFKRSFSSYFGSREPKKIYFRTLTILNEVKSNNNIDLNLKKMDIVQITEALKYEIRKITSKKIRNCAFDIFKFETEKQKYLITLKSDAYLVTKQIIYDEMANALFCLDKQEILDQKFLIDNDVKIIESKWSWAKKKKEKLLKNLSIFPKYYQTLLEIDLENETIIEQEQDSLNIVLLHAFSKPKTLSKAINEISQYFDPKEVKKLYNEFTDLVIERVRDLVYIMVISWHDWGNPSN